MEKLEAQKLLIWEFCIDGQHKCKKKLNNLGRSPFHLKIQSSVELKHPLIKTSLIKQSFLVLLSITDVLH